MGTPRRKAWPVGQVVKTAASHAVNIGSNPVRVTIPKKRCFFGNRKLDNWIKVCYCRDAVAIQQLVLIRARVHPFPSRTRKLSSLLPTILGWRRPGKIGSANTERSHSCEWLLFLYSYCGSAIHCSKSATIRYNTPISLDRGIFYYGILYDRRENY